MNAKKLICSLFAVTVLSLGTLPANGQPPMAAFQYAAFYNGLLEFSFCPTMTINGPVHCNSNIYVGTPSGSTLTFNYLVSASGTITSPSNVGIDQANWTGTTTYNGTPTPGWAANYPRIDLPIGTNSYAEIIRLPAPGEDAIAASNVLSQQRYYYKAGLVILVTNITTALNGTNSTNVLTSVILKSSMFDPAPLVFSYTNNLPTNTGALYTNWLSMTTNWRWFGASNWLTTNSSFYDGRQNITNHITQIDIGRFSTWIATNTNAIAKWNSTTPFNGIIYIADMRTTNTMYMNAVRLTNGQTIPTVGASNLVAPLSRNYAYNIPGFSVATINPLYVQGPYNCPGNTNVSSTNTLGCQPCSVICDALTILSPAWSDNNSFTGSVPSANTTTVNTAIIAGNVPSTGTSVTQYSGGVQNLPRLLENWTGDTLWLNTSFVNLYPSSQATHQFEQPPAYYSAPTRRYSFDQNFLSTSKLPPGTPVFARSLASVAFASLNQSYDGSPKPVTVITTPPGLNVTVSYGPNSNNVTPPTTLGSYAVSAVINDQVYLGSATNTLVISQGTATVTFSNLSQTYDGTAKTVSVTTVPPGLSVDLSYDGSTTAPTSVGSYTVVGTVDDPNYTGSATNTLVIAPPAPTPISLTGMTSSVDGSFQLNFTNLPGFGFSVLSTTDPSQPLSNWNFAGSVVEVTPGQYQFIDTQATNNPQQFYIIRSP